MDGLTTSALASDGRHTLLDRVVRWQLDPDGDLYGDERERRRWSAGIATAASLQWMALPWAAATLVWMLGRPAAIALGLRLGPRRRGLPLLIPARCFLRRRQATRDPARGDARRPALAPSLMLSPLDVKKT